MSELSFATEIYTKAVMKTSKSNLYLVPGSREVLYFKLVTGTWYQVTVTSLNYRTSLVPGARYKFSLPVLITALVYISVAKENSLKPLLLYLLQCPNHSKISPT